MKTTSLIAFFTLCVEIAPMMCHRLITDPYPEREWESVIVASDPIKIREKKQNQTTDLKLKQVLRPKGRSFDECSYNDFKCLYGEENEDKSNNQIVEKFIKHYTNVGEVQFENEMTERNASDDIENENSRKSYWTIIDSQTHHHPYDDKNGWVTLDPVPWSTSKISKWQPSKLAGQHDNEPWNYGPSTQAPVHRFWVSGSGLHTQRPTTQWGIGTNDIITDNKPSGFPTEGNNGYGALSSGSTYHSANVNSMNNNDFYQSQGFKGNPPSSFHQNSHPSTYPSNGNGEWILLSTTKGYSFPHAHKWPTKNGARVFASRKIKPTEISRYHEEDLNEKFILDKDNSFKNRKSDSGNESDGVHVKDYEHKEQFTESNQAPSTESPKKKAIIKTFRRKVRLQVLPSPQNTSTSHGGLLEVNSDPQTVDEAQQQDQKFEKIKTVTKVKKNKIRGYKIVPVDAVAGKGMSNKNTAALAAVGAGMIPATMAFLVPMALGKRRKRNVLSKVFALKNRP